MTPTLPAKLLDALAARYRERGRHYHNLAHVQALLRWLDQSRDLAADPLAIEAAIWFHDAVYDTRRNDNEATSAALVREELQVLGWPAQAIDKVAAMVLATAGHAPDQSDPDTELFLDLDLSILGQGPAVYADYAQAIRAEYAWVDDTRYAAGRRQVLQAFLVRPHIYFTPRCRDAWEAAAISNMRDELSRLGGGAG